VHRKNAYNRLRAWQLKWVIANISVFISEAKQMWEGVCPMWAMNRVVIHATAYTCH